MADVKWIKICTDIFDDEKILLIESMPEKDSLIVIWFKLLCMAGKQNNSGVFMINEKIAYTDEMLATIFRRPINTVRLALSVFEQYGMIEIVDGAITIPNWEKHQNIDKLEKLKEQTRQRVATHRAKQRLLASNEECNVTVTLRNATDKIREDKNRTDIDNNIDNVESDSSMKPKPYELIIDYLHSKAHTHYRANTKNTIKHINARLTEGYTIDDFKTVIDKKCAEWKGTEMEQYLCPDTLFGTKFEKYLNAKVTVKRQQQNQQSTGNIFVDMMIERGMVQEGDFV